MGGGLSLDWIQRMEIDGTKRLRISPLQVLNFLLRYEALARDLNARRDVPTWQHQKWSSYYHNH